ncbi:MAG: LptF/LptG family permease [Bacteroidia bacterium]|nr:LptF/LptG family permease [Bacteroidia bacterium]NNJ56596.1 YjgP/YjgQ family permease [Bacteroidia bacterium]
MKLTKIDYYIIKRYLGAFLLALGLFTVIIIVFDLAEKIDDFMENDAPFSKVLVNYYMNWVPFLLNLFSPVFVFISVIFFTSKMAQKSEIVAILASGVSYKRLMVPYLITAVFLALFSFSLFAWIIPRADKTRVDFENTYIRDRTRYTKSSIRTQLEPGVMLSMGNYNLSDSAGYKVSLEHFENGELKSKLFADRLNWNKKTNKWRLSKYWIREFEDGMEILTQGARIDTMIAFNPEDFFRKNDDVQMFNLKELDHMIEMEEMRGTGNTFFYVTEKYKRYSTPFAILILTVIGVSVASKKTRGGIGLNLGVGLLLSFTFLIVMQFFIAYGSSGSLPPLIAVWIPNIIFGAIAVVLYKFAQK